ncbi:MAG TPA: hypothetical protein VN961_12330, partial [Streptosporangiaceae bacterium]|nr:hypothetical protein [Streptosporangiaceae bacterium]
RAKRLPHAPQGTEPRCRGLPAWIPDLVSHCHGTQTVLTGSLDQSALYGVLAEIEALGLDLMEVRRLASRSEPPGMSGDISSP